VKKTPVFIAGKVEFCLVKYRQNVNRSTKNRKKVASLTVCYFGTNQQEERIFIDFVADDTVIII